MNTAAPQVLRLLSHNTKRPVLLGSLQRISSESRQSDNALLPLEYNFTTITPEDPRSEVSILYCSK